MANIGDLNIRIGATIDGLQKGLRKAERSLQRSSKKMANLSQNLVLSVSTPLIGLAGAALKASADLETLQVNFETLTGSAEAASKNIASLKKLAASTPFSLSGLAKSQQTMMGFGFSTQEAFSQLNLLGNAAMGNSEVLQGLAVVMGQVKGAGVAMTQDLNQFINQGVPIYQLLGEVTGKTTGELKKMASEGKLSFDLIQAGFVAANEKGGLFYKNMEKQSKTLNGVFSTLKDNVTGVLVEIGNDISESFDLKGAADGLIKKIQAIKEAFMELSPEQKKTAVRMAGIVAVAPLLLGALAAIVSVVGTLAGALSVLISPVTLVIAALAALAAGFIYVYNKSETFRKALRAIGRFLKSFIGDTLDQLKGLANALVKFFTGDFTGAFEEASNVIRLQGGKMSDAINDARDSIEEEAPEPISLDRILGFDISSFANKVDEASGDIKDSTITLKARIDELKKQFDKASTDVERKKIGGELLGLVTAQIKSLEEAGKAVSRELTTLQSKLQGLVTGGGSLSAKGSSGGRPDVLADAIKAKELELLELNNQIGNEVFDKDSDEAIRARVDILKKYFDTISKLSPENTKVISEISKTKKELASLGAGLKKEELFVKSRKELNKLRNDLVNLKKAAKEASSADDFRKLSKDYTDLSDNIRKSRLSATIGSSILSEDDNLNEDFVTLIKFFKSLGDKSGEVLVDSINKKLVSVGEDPLTNIDLNKKILSKDRETGVFRPVLETDEAIQRIDNLSKKSKELRSGVQNLFGNLTNNLDTTLSGFESFFDGLTRMTLNFADELGTIDFSKVWEGLKKGSLEAMTSVAEVVTGLVNGIVGSMVAALDQKLDAVNSKFDKQKAALDQLDISEEARAKHRAVIEERQAKAIAKIRTKQAKAEKKAAIAQAIMNTAVAVTSVLANPFLAAAIGALGAVQVANIASTPIPQFANGGIVSGRTLAEVGEYGSASRGNPEVIAPLNKLKSMISDVGGGGHITGEFRLRGDDLVAAVEQGNRRTARFSGNSQF